jgi:signal transduction histidine kinase
MDSNDATQIASMREGATLSAGPILSKGAMDRAVHHTRTGDLKTELADAPVALAEEHLEKICSELADNGFKFSRNGDLVEVLGTLSDTMYCLSIRDRGKGMSSEDIGKIGGFIKFKRRLHEQQGPGLGLMIAKRLIELHGGSLTIVSDPGVETTVTAMLPLLKRS